MPSFQLTYSKNCWSADSNDCQLFHVSSKGNIESIIKSKEFWFIKNNFSNDDRDGNMLEKVEIVLENIEKKLSEEEKINWKIFKMNIEADCKENDKTIKYERREKIIFHNPFNIPEVYVMSFARKTSKLLWDKYGDTCIEINRVNLDKWLIAYNEKQNKYELTLSAKVIYEDKIKLEILEEIITNGYKDFCKNIDTNNEKDILRQIKVELFICAYFFKDNLWEYEDEFRFILLRTNNNEIHEGDKSKPKIVISFIGENGANYFDIMLLKDVQSCLDDSQI